MRDILLVLIRHGQSEWNKQNLFTGWVDVELSEKGRKEAIQAGKELKKRNCHFDCAFSSALKRAIHTMDLVLEQMSLQKLPKTKAWQLNERHYGALQGKNRQEVIKQYGSDQVHRWRRDFDTVPPLLQEKQPLQNKKLYPDLQQAPKGESLKDTQKRVLAFWEKKIFPCIKRGQSVLITAHGNSLRSLIKYLEKIPDDQISSLEIPTGCPLIYSLNKSACILSKTGTA